MGSNDPSSAGIQKKACVRAGHKRKRLPVEAKQFVSSLEGGAPTGAVSARRTAEDIDEQELADFTQRKGSGTSGELA